MTTLEKAEALRPIQTSREERPARWVPIVPYALAALFSVAYATYSIVRHQNVLTGGFDLGLFEQAVRGYASLGAPIADLRGVGFSLLGDHFHPILVLIAPFYRLFSCAETLLVAQAVLLGSSVIPVARMATRQTGPLGGILIGLAYGWSWGLQEGVGFDFHEVCFAVPLLAFALERVILRRWLSAALIAAPLVLVKEDLGVTVAAIGLIIFLRGQRRIGVVLAGFGLASTALETFVLIPAANPTDHYMFWGHMAEDGAEETSTISAIVGIFTNLLTPWAKIRTLLMTLVPTAFLALGSPLVLAAVPTLLWRFATDNVDYWVDTRHYNLVLMPVVFMAMLDVLPRLADAARPAVRWLGRLAVPATLVIAVVLGAQTDRPLMGLVDGTALQRDPEAAAIREVLAEIPDGATVGASNHLAPQLTSRCTVYLLPDFREAGVRPDWVVVLLGGDWPLDEEGQEEEIARLEALGYVEDIRTDTLLVLRGPSVESLTSQ